MIPCLYRIIDNQNSYNKNDTIEYGPRSRSMKELNQKNTICKMLNVLTIQIQVTIYSSQSSIAFPCVQHLMSNHGFHFLCKFLLFVKSGYSERVGYWVVFWKFLIV